MAGLIEELKRDHVAIESMLAKAKDSSISHLEARKILMAAQTSLITHLKKEDDQLYPVLNRAALSDAALKQMVDFYCKDMEEITSNAISFFDKYSPANAAINLEFVEAFGKLFSTITRRLRNEENTLFKEYDKSTRNR